MSRFSAELKAFCFDEQAPQEFPLGEILKLGDGEQIFGFLLATFAFPCALPVPHFGLSIPFGLVLMFFSIQLLMGQTQPWLPPRLSKRKVSLELVRKLANLGIPWIERLEAVTQPRYPMIHSSPLGRALVAGVLIITCIILALPVPGTNLPPAIAIFVTGIGLLEEDGLTCLVGIGLCLLSVGLGSVILSALFLGGFNLLDAVHVWRPA